MPPKIAIVTEMAIILAVVVDFLFLFVRERVNSREEYIDLWKEGR